jgi:hypothetical protein
VEVGLDVGIDQDVGFVRLDHGDLLPEDYTDVDAFERPASSFRLQDHVRGIEQLPDARGSLLDRLDRRRRRIKRRGADRVGVVRDGDHVVSDVVFEQLQEEDERLLAVLRPFDSVSILDGPAAIQPH